MTTNDHIAAIKEHLKAIEAKKQPKKEPKRYLVVEIDTETTDKLARLLISIAAKWSRENGTMFRLECVSVIKNFFALGKIITVNEE